MVSITTLYKSIQEKGLPNLTNNAALENKAAFYYAATSGQRGQRQYASYVPRRETGSGGYIPRRRPLQSTGVAGDISSRAAPFPMIGKGRGDWVDRFPQGYLLLLDCGKFSL